MESEINSLLSYQDKLIGILHIVCSLSSVFLKIVEKAGVAIIYNNPVTYYAHGIKAKKKAVGKVKNQLPYKLTTICTND